MLPCWLVESDVVHKEEATSLQTPAQRRAVYSPSRHSLQCDVSIPAEVAKRAETKVSRQSVRALVSGEAGSEKRPLIHEDLLFTLTLKSSLVIVQFLPEGGGRTQSFNICNFLDFFGTLNAALCIVFLRMCYLFGYSDRHCD